MTMAQFESLIQNRWGKYSFIYVLSKHFVSFSRNELKTIIFRGFLAKIIVHLKNFYSE